MGTLYIVATPIGNLEDITYRAVRILREVDLICCEDTRHTKILLDRYKITKPLVSYHQHSKLTKIDHIISQLKSGKNIALVSDAGTPGINDPGGVLVEKVLESCQACHSEGVPAGRVEETLLKSDFSTPSNILRAGYFRSSRNDKINIIPIPGPSAITTLLSASGIVADKFLHLGYLPKKKGRKTLISNVYRLMSDVNIPIVIYESPYRLVKTLKDFQEIADWDIIIGRELTKKFEEIVRGDINSVIKYFTDKKPKGEFVICFKREQK